MFTQAHAEIHIYFVDCHCRSWQRYKGDVVVLSIAALPTVDLCCTCPKSCSMWAGSSRLYKELFHVGWLFTIRSTDDMVV